MALIEPRTLKGFRDYLPESMIPREWLIDTARRVYRSYGFSPIDTPALEYEEILTGKGGEESDKQLYRFEDHGGRRVALRFDLTVPLARFAAQYIHELGVPFKRYHIAPVWRGENTQRGRYREFMQCDFDTIGSESVTVDAEAVLVIHDLLRALGIDDFVVHVNHRMLLSGLLARAGLEGRAGAVLRALDKLGKIGAAKVEEEMIAAAGMTSAQAREILALAEITGTNEDVLAGVARLARGNAKAEEGVDKLAQVLAGARAGGVSDERVRLDPSIARGLDYYTGTVFETYLGKLPSIGSVCSGGRYDDLAQLYTKERLPGVGASLGLDRLLAALEELQLVEKRRASAPVFLPFFDAARWTDYVSLASRLREWGVGVELYPEPKKLGAQLKYADRRGFKVALIVGESEWQVGRAQVKFLSSGETRELALFDASGALGEELLRALSEWAR